MSTVSILNTDAQLSGKTLGDLESTQTITGAKSFNRSPSAPFAVQAGSAVVTNLDADKVDGLHSTSLVKYAEGTVTDGQLLIGKSSDNSLNRAALTAGTGVTITNGAGTITISVAAAGVLNKSTTEQDVSGTAAATDVYDYTVPGGTLGTTGILRLTVTGDADNTSGGGVNLTIAVSYGGTNLYNAAVTTVANNATNMTWLVEALINANGATNSQRTHTKITLGANGANADGVSQAVAAHLTSEKNALAIDSTAAQHLKVTVTWASASGGCHCRRWTAVTEAL